MPTLELDFQTGNGIVEQFLPRSPPWYLGTRGVGKFSRVVVDDLIIYACYHDSEDQYRCLRLNITFNGQRIVLTRRHAYFRDYFDIRGSDEAVVEARLRGLI